jgi:hypothetical protein
MRRWAAIVSEDRFAGERLYAFDSLILPDAGRAGGPDAGDLVALVVAGQPPKVFGLGQIGERLGGDEDGGTDLAITYTHRLFDQPAPVDERLVQLDPEGLVEVDQERYESLAGRVGGVQSGSRSEWFVSVALPIEAATRADAVREFWTHVAKLGPRELPAYVWPRGDELAMQAFLLGEETNLDPEED